MSFIGMLGAQVGAGVASSASEYFQRGADKVFGIDRKQEQIDQQRKLHILAKMLPSGFTCTLDEIFSITISVDDIEIGAAGVKKQGIAIKGYMSLRLINTTG